MHRTVTNGKVVKQKIPISAAVVRKKVGKLCMPMDTHSHAKSG